MKKFSGEQMNDIFEIVKDNAEWDDGEFFTLTEEMLGDKYKKLVGYKVGIDSEYDHKHDGQMVDYGFTFISPKGEITDINTEMCLVIGWNHWREETIK